MAETTDDVDAPTEAEAPPPPAGSRRVPWAWPALAAAAIVGLVVSNVFLLLQIEDNSDEVAALRSSVERVDDRIDGIAADAASAATNSRAATDAVGQIEARVGAVETLTGALLATSPAPEAQPDTAPDGLPVFTGDSQNDPALGLVVADLGGLEYYLGQDIGFDLADGRSRAIVVWAHWCPFCQEELPPLADWITENAAGLPNTEILSITTAIDPSAANPLIPYLDEQQFPFPVLVDDSGELSQLLGVNAFPFWIFFGPDGSVLGRLTGLRGMDELGSIFAQLEAVAAA